MSGNDNAIDLAVYFTNGRYEKIRSDRLVILDNPSPDSDRWHDLVKLTADGYVIVNRHNICIIRKWNHGPYDDD